MRNIKDKDNIACYYLFTTALITLFIFRLFYLIPAIFTHSDSVNCTVIDPSGINLEYSFDNNNYNFNYVSDANYTVNFNLTTMQANYVKYIGTGGISHFKTYYENDRDPYKYDILTHEDYTNIQHHGEKLVRGYLVPNADMSGITFVMTNAVPMINDFYNGTWKLLEKFIREKYIGKLIYKGCDYDDNFIKSNTGKQLYIPSGCYYLVFDNNKLIDYGYLKNQNDKQQKPEKKLPFWCVKN